MPIKLTNRDPKKFEFTPRDIIINTEEGSLFYRTPKGLFRIQGDKISTENITEFLPGNLIKGDLNISGSVIPIGSGSFDLGSTTRPWKEIHVMSSSIHFYDEDGEIGKLSYEKDIGLRISDEQDTQERITAIINGGSF